MGFNSKIEDVFTGAMITAKYLLDAAVDNVYVIGSHDLENMLRYNAIHVVSPEKAEHLVVGFDKNINYSKISFGLDILLKGGRFFACNADSTFPHNGKILPGSAAMIGAIAYSANKNPEIIGKPKTYALSMLSDIYNTNNEAMLVVGDCLDIDIKMAKDFGCPWILSNDIIKGGRYEYFGI
jgi:4-nitrophenyl phosphatase